jgi:hypothetical protein
MHRQEELENAAENTANEEVYPNPVVQGAGGTGAASMLSLQSRDLTEVPDDVFSFATLQTLDLSRNSLAYLPPAIAALQALRELDVSRNWLRTLPPELGQLSQLVSINALGNKLNHRSLPLQELAQLPNLRLLDLQWQKTDKCRRAGAVLAMQQFPDRVEVRLSAATLPPPSERGYVGNHACDRDAQLLRSQLEPWGTPIMRARLAKEFGVITDPEEHDRAEVMNLLLAGYEADPPRAVRRVGREGTLPIRPALYDELLREMREWAGEMMRIHCTHALTCGSAQGRGHRRSSGSPLEEPPPAGRNGQTCVLQHTWC